MARILAGSAMLLPLVLGGCPGLNLGGGGLVGDDIVTLEIVNDTDWLVDPIIVIGEEPGDLSGFFGGGGEDLATGLVEPGETLVFDIDCHSIAEVFSDAPEQLDDNGDLIGATQPTRILGIGDDFDCGDLVRFRFVGEGDTFDVLLSVNNRVVPG